MDSDDHKKVPAFKRVILLIDEFDGIPQAVLSDFLYTLRQIYLSDEMQCPHSVGIVGVRSIAQLDYDRSISPFNIQDEFHLPNFSLEQVTALFSQYTQEVGQPFTPEVIASIHKQTAGQPFLGEPLRTDTNGGIRCSQNRNAHHGTLCEGTCPAP